MTSLLIGVDQNENGGSGFYVLNGGRLTVTGTESIGEGLATVGSFTQTGGTQAWQAFSLGIPTKTKMAAADSMP